MHQLRVERGPQAFEAVVHPTAPTVPPRSLQVERRCREHQQVLRDSAGRRKARRFLFEEVSDLC